MSLASRFLERARQIHHHMRQKLAAARQEARTQRRKQSRGIRPTRTNPSGYNTGFERLEPRELLSASTPAYTITDLGTLGGTTSIAYGINASGQIVGESLTSGGSEDAFLYTPTPNTNTGVLTDLGTLGGTGTSIAYAINASGQIVGESPNPSGNEHAFLYSGGAMSDLGTVGGVDSVATAINDGGEIVGYSGNGIFINGVEEQNAFAYLSGQINNLGTLGGASSYAYAVDPVGYVLGTADPFNSTAGEAFIYGNSQMTGLGTIGGAPTDTSQVTGAINNEAVGFSTTGSGVTNAFVYFYGGSLVDLGTLGGSYSYAYAINTSGVVVGSSTTGGGLNHAFVDYTGPNLLDLNYLTDPAAGWTLTQANAINASGQIVGYGINPQGQLHAFLLTPTHTTLSASIVLSNSTIIPNGSTATNTINDTNFGSLVQGSPELTETFSIINFGGGTLTFSPAVSVPSGFTLVKGPSSTPAGNFTTFEIELPTTFLGTFSGMVTIQSNDQANLSYTFDITGTITEPPAVGVSGDGQPIANHSTATSLTNGTNLGQINQESAGTSPTYYTTQQYTITNVGGGTLDLGAVILPAHFGLVSNQITGTDLTPNQSVSFTIELSTAIVGTFSGNITFTTNDPKNLTFLFKITAQVIVPPPDVDPATIESLTTSGPVTKGTPLSVTANNVAIDLPGSIKSVLFYYGISSTYVTTDKLLGTVTAAQSLSGNFTLNNIATSTFAASSNSATDYIFARTLDSYGRYIVAASTIVTINDNTPVVKTLTLSPVNPAANESLKLTASATVLLNTISYADFYWDPTYDPNLSSAVNLANSILLTPSVVNTKPSLTLTTILNESSLNWNFPTSGTATFLAVAVDASGTRSNPFVVTTTVNSPPSIPIINTTPASTVARGQSLTVTATVVDNDTLKQVAFYLGQPGSDGAKLLGYGAKSTATTVSGVTTYTYKLTAKISTTQTLGDTAIYVVATNSHSVVTTSDPSPITIADAITSLATTPATIAPDNTVTLTANGVTNADNSVTAVNYYWSAGNPGINAMVLLGTTTSGTTTVWKYTGILPSSTAETNPFPTVGPVTFYAQTVDNVGGGDPGNIISYVVKTLAVQPIVGSLTAAPSTTNPTSLTAGFFTLAGKTVVPTQVQFWISPEGSDAPFSTAVDTELGQLTKATNGTWTLTLTNLSAGTYTVFARVLDSQGIWSEAASLAITVD